MRIHIAEEARHISFARHYLRHRVPRMPGYRRLMLGVVSPSSWGSWRGSCCRRPGR